MSTKTFFVGFDGKQAVDSKTTQAQIEEVKKLTCALVTPLDKPILWEDLDDSNEPRTIFQTILLDRMKRIDENTLLTGRASFAVITAEGERMVRLEYYEGHDVQELVFDLRAQELKGKDLPRFLNSTLQTD